MTIAAGETSQMGIDYQELRDCLLPLLTQSCSDVDDAHDGFNWGYLQYCIQVNLGTPIKNPKGYILACAKHEAQKLQSARARTTPINPQQFTVRHDIARTIAAMAAVAATREAECDRIRDRVAAKNFCLKRLQPRARDVLRWHFDGANDAFIASHLKMTLVAVRQCRKRALDFLKRCAQKALQVNS